MKLLFPVFASVALVISQGLTQLQNNASISTTPSIPETQTLFSDVPITTPTSETFVKAVSFIPTEVVSDVVLPVNFQPTPAYAFGNPAGCAETVSPDLSPDQMLANVQSALGDSYTLAERRQLYIWNGALGTYMDVTQDPNVYEFAFNNFQHPLTYRADPVVTTFLNNGFVVWLRVYGGNFRLTAIPMVAGVSNSVWADYVTAYWQADGKPNDEYIYPVMKKLPCHWVIDAGYLSNENVAEMFDLDWNLPDYLSAGRQYLASTCAEANRILKKRKWWPGTDCARRSARERRSRPAGRMSWMAFVIEPRSSVRFPRYRKIEA